MDASTKQDLRKEEADLLLIVEDITDQIKTTRNPNTEWLSKASKALKHTNAEIRVIRLKLEGLSDLDAQFRLVAKRLLTPEKYNLILDELQQSYKQGA